jgi:hypothetical protein
VLRVTRRSDGWQGDISDTPGRLSLDLNLVVLDYRIPKSDWGVALHSNSGSYSADKQAVTTPDNPEGEFSKLGTRIDGYFSYLVPTLYYVTNERGRFFESGKLGGGIGYGAVRFNGDVILAPDRDLSLGQERVSASGDVSKAFTFVLFFALRQEEGLEFRVSVTTTRFKDSDYKFSAEEFRMVLSKPFTIFR